MNIELSTVIYAASTYYDILLNEGDIQHLIGYDDKNFLIKDSKDGSKYVLKIVNPDYSDKRLTGE